ncbi:MAG: sugar ABC transporter permease [Verrucomicrobiae bacterium]|nr:sugar ABC transporter permease [Verrucomicrobiae bacterium]
MPQSADYQRERWGAFLFILPNFIGFLIFTSLPIFFSLLISFTSWDVFTTPKFIGIRNYVELLSFHPRNIDAVITGGERMLLFTFVLLAIAVPSLVLAAFFYYVKEKRQRALKLLIAAVVLGIILFPVSRANFGFWMANDPRFWYYGLNTLFLMLMIPVSMFGSLLLAILLNQRLPGIYLFRLLYYLPTICTGVGIYILWMWIYNPDYGLLNGILRSTFHVEGPRWLQEIGWAKPALMLMAFWTSVGGFNCVLYLAALQGVPIELYEASEIDGANWWQKFWAIIWPLVSPTTFYIFIMSIINGFQSGFDAAYVMTQGGPAGATTTITYYIYDQAFRNFEMGYASAISWVLFALVFGVTLINYKLAGKLVHY